jgi:hypothetical protein
MDRNLPFIIIFILTEKKNTTYDSLNNSEYFGYFSSIFFSSEYIVIMYNIYLNTVLYSY